MATAKTLSPAAETARPKQDTVKEVRALIDGWIDNGECEFVRDFAMPLPMTVITRMLGFPMDDLPRLKLLDGLVNGHGLRLA